MTKPLPSAELLRSLLDYDPNTRIFLWKIRVARCVQIGQRAGNINDYGYRRIKVLDSSFLAHRLAWMYVYGSSPVSSVDHKNRCRDDNWIDNLRCASSSENGSNRSIQGNNCSSVPGVYAHRRGWRAHLSFERSHYYLGEFRKFEDAVAARQAAEIKYFKDFRRVP